MSETKLCEPDFEDNLVEKLAAFNERLEKELDIKGEDGSLTVHEAIDAQIKVFNSLMEQNAEGLDRTKITEMAEKAESLKSIIPDQTIRKEDLMSGMGQMYAQQFPRLLKQREKECPEV